MIHSVTTYCKFCIYKDTVTVHIISFEYPLIKMAVYISDEYNSIHCSLMLLLLLAQLCRHHVST